MGVSTPFPATIKVPKKNNPINSMDLLTVIGNCFIIVSELLNYIFLNSLIFFTCTIHKGHRVDIDNFYEIDTGWNNILYNLCAWLP